MSANDQVTQLAVERKANADFQASINLLASAVETAAADLLKGFETVPEHDKDESYLRYEKEYLAPLEFIAANAGRKASERVHQFASLADAYYAPALQRTAAQGLVTPNAAWGRAAERMKLGINSNLCAILHEDTAALKKSVGKNSIKIRKEKLEEALMTSIAILDHVLLHTHVPTVVEAVGVLANLWKGFKNGFGLASRNVAESMKPLDIVRRQMINVMVTIYQMPIAPERDKMPPGELIPRDVAKKEFEKDLESWMGQRNQPPQPEDDPVETAALMQSASRLDKQGVDALFQGQSTGAQPEQPEDDPVETVALMDSASRLNEQEIDSLVTRKSMRPR